MLSLVGVEDYLPSELRGRPRLSYFPSLEWVPLAASASGTIQTLVVDQDAPVLIVGGSRVITDSPADTTFSTAGPFKVTMTQTSSGQQLMNIAGHIENLFGTAQLPAIWAYPLLLPANSSLNVTLQNMSATAYVVRITFLAMKIIR